MVNMILFVNISAFFKCKIIYITTFSVARWDTWNDLIEHFGMQGEDLIEHTNDKCRVFTF